MNFHRHISTLKGPPASDTSGIYKDFQDLDLGLNYHAVEPSDTDDQVKKKRRPNIRACDACAIRKTKCEAQRPCRHCLHNNLECTQLRERKKLGPKNLRKKTLDLINSIREPVQTEPPEKLESPPPEIPVVLTAANVAEILGLSNEPHLCRILGPLTLGSFVRNVPKLIGFLNAHFGGDAELNAVSTDPVFLSKLLTILTLCLLIVESLIKLVYFNFLYQNDATNGRNLEKFQRFQKVLQSKIVEVLAGLDRQMLFPSNGTVENQFQINYNQLISAIHLFNYYQLTSHGNTSAKDHQKLLYLRRAITFYQLIELPVLSQELNFLVQLFELFQYLVTLERLHAMFDLTLFIKNNNLILQNHTWNQNLQIARLEQDDTTKLFEIFDNVQPDLFDARAIKTLSSLLNIVVSCSLTDADAYLEKYRALKKKVDVFGVNEDPETRLPALEIVKDLVLFKCLVVYARNLSEATVKSELSALTEDLNRLISLSVRKKGSVLDHGVILKIQLLNFQLLPHLLQLLKVVLDLNDQAHQDDEIVKFSNNLTQYFMTAPHNKRLILANGVLSSWFARLNKINLENQTYLNKLLSDLDQQQQFQRHPATAPVSVSHTSTNSNLTLATNDSSPVQTSFEDFLAMPPLTTVKLAPVGEFLTKESATKPSGGYFTSQEPPIPIPPTVTAANAVKDEEPLPISESTRNLYNLFNQITDDLTTTSNSNSLTNLFQYNGIHPNNSQPIKVERVPDQFIL